MLALNPDLVGFESPLGSGWSGTVKATCPEVCLLIQNSETNSARSDGRHKDDVEVVNSPYHTGRLCKPCYGPIACVHLSKLDCSEAALAAVEQANADVAPRRPLSQCKALVGMRFQHLGRWVFQQRWLSVGAHQPTSSSQSWPAAARRLLTSATLAQSWKACPCP